ncbi:MAG: hypothetical protein HYX60_04665 [Legionella longbeachae]|nr:hypothetical protein [Legionella longbeachae]
MPLFIIDFDDTIASKNTHNAVSEITSGGIDAIWAVIKKIPPIGSPEIWQEIIRSILSHEHRLAIASFNAFGASIIPKYLQEIIGLNLDEISHIHVESWLPLNPNIANKNDHIRFVIKDMGYSGTPESIVLIDDDPKNIRAAQNNGYKTIHAIDNYLQKVHSLSKNWSQSIDTNSFFNTTVHDNKKDKPNPETKCTIM